MSLFNTLLALSNTNPTFYYTKYNNYITFGYRMARYSDWLLEGALQSRGITFDMATEKCVCMPMDKFFNVNENPLSTVALFHNNQFPLEINEYQKLDGSLISIFYDGELKVKSKMSFTSDQAIQALNIINNYDKYLQTYIIDICKSGYTINCEYTSYLNQIVVKYPDHKLTVLNVRHNMTGKYTTAFNDVFDDYNMLVPKETLTFNSEHELEEYFSYVKTLKGIEGYVYVNSYNNMWLKLKTSEYTEKHSLMGNSIDQVKFKFEQILRLSLTESIDDYIASLDFKSELQLYVINLHDAIVTAYSTLADVLKQFIGTNVNLTKKEFALKAKSELNDFEFTLAMMFYQKPFDESQLKQIVCDRHLKFKSTYNL